jgi:hypothetical protein
MITSQSKILGIPGKVFLLVLIVPYSLYLYSTQQPLIEVYLANPGSYPFEILTYISWLFSIFGLIFAFFFANIYPRSAGIILIVVGGVSTLLMFWYPPIDLGGGQEGLLFCFPIYLLTIIIGVSFEIKSIKQKITAEAQKNLANP